MLKYDTYLSVIVTEDRRSVLRAAVVALLVERRGIVERVEVLHQIFIGRVVSFKGKIVHFNLLSVSSAHLQTITTSGHTNIRATGEKWLAERIECTSLYVGFAFAVSGPINPTCPSVTFPLLGKLLLKS
jgi:protein gp37